MKKIILLIMVMSFITAYGQNNWYIDNIMKNGSGSFKDPFNNFLSAMQILRPGDTLLIMPGTYYLTSFILPVNSGSASKWITVKAYNQNDRPVLKTIAATNAIRTINVGYYRWEGIDIDGDFLNGVYPLINLRAGTHHFTFYNCKWYESHTDGLVIEETDYVKIDSCEIYYCVHYKAEGKRKDAHGIMFKSGNKLTVNNCNIHHNSGDCIQSGTSLTFPTWDSLIITNNHLWSGMIDTVVNTMPSHTYWSENGIDTKTPDSADIAQSEDPDWRAYVYIDNNILHGFNGDYDWPAIAINMAVDATIKNTLVYESAIAYRLMGPSIITSTGTISKGPIVKMINCISYDTFWSALWPQTNVDSLRIWNCTFDNSIDTLWWPGIHVRAPSYFDDRVSFNKDNFDMRNTIFVNSMPPELAGIVNNTVYIANPADFVDYEHHNYHLAETSGAVNSGVTIPEVTVDFDCNPRIAGEYDIGAFEKQHDE
ncbi:MAG: right-handed parallel beta-helix repeat-containing protein [Bacteroidales bacterium]|nr:right-handed parallel beta-helix repeat-containing protein [Bacteroidales bacterium]